MILLAGMRLLPGTGLLVPLWGPMVVSPGFIRPGKIYIKHNLCVRCCRGNLLTFTRMLSKPCYIVVLFVTTTYSENETFHAPDMKDTWNAVYYKRAMDNDIWMYSAPYVDSKH